MEYAAVYATENILGGQATFAYNTETAKTLESSIPERYKNLIVVTPISSAQTFFLGIADQHILKHDMGSVAVSGILPIKLPNSHNNFEVSREKQWLLIGETTQIVGKILNITKAFDADGECEQYMTQLMPWVSELHVNTTDIQTKLETCIETDVEAVVEELRHNNTITIAALKTKLMEKLKTSLASSEEEAVLQCLMGN